MFQLDCYVFSDDSWYITRDVNGEDGQFRCKQTDVFVPQLGWEFLDQSYFDGNFDNCKARCLKE